MASLEKWKSTLKLCGLSIVSLLNNWTDSIANIYILTYVTWWNTYANRDHNSHLLRSQPSFDILPKLKPMHNPQYNRWISGIHYIVRDLFTNVSHCFSLRHHQQHTDCEIHVHLLLLWDFAKKHHRPHEMHLWAVFTYNKWFQVTAHGMF